MGLSTFIRLGKTAMDTKRTYDSFNPHAAASLGKKAATAPLKVYENVPRWIMRGLQLLLGLVVVGFYGHPVDVDRRAGVAQSPEWIFGLTVAGLSGISAIVLALAALGGAVSDRLRTYRWFAWDLVLFVMWIVVFGIFGGIFLKRDDAEKYKGTSTSLMKAVVWLDLANAILWLISGVYGIVKTFLGRKVDRIGGRVAGKLSGKKATLAKEMYEV